MIELTIQLQTDSTVPMYEQIYQYIRDEIVNGELPKGERLPSTRHLSDHLQVSRTTVDLAYAQLSSEGYIEAQPYRGYFVCDISQIWQLTEKEIQKPRPEKLQEEEKKEQSFLYRFSPSGIDLNSFPAGAWRKLSREILLDESSELMELGDNKGELTLRKEICNYLHRARGVNCTSDQVIIGAGNDYLLFLLSCILGRDHVIAMENPTYKKAYDLLFSIGYRMKVIDMDKNGMMVDRLEASGADIAYVMPSHQFPMGTVMPMKRRQELLEWAIRGERFLIEDDYDSEFRYKGKPIPALQGSDRNGRVIYLGTFSRAIAPAIRVSYLVLPEVLLNRFKERVGMLSSTVSRVDQMILTGFLKEGYFERHLNRMRSIYRRKHDLLIEELKPLNEICKVVGEYAGMHLLLTFRNGWEEEKIVALAADRRVKVYGLSSNFVQPPFRQVAPTVILGYANLTEEEIHDAVQLLIEAWLHERKE